MTSHTYVTYWMDQWKKVGKVSGYFNETRSMVSIGILEYGKTRKVLNNYTIGSIFEVTADRKNNDLKKVDQILRGKHGQWLLSVIRKKSVSQ